MTTWDDWENLTPAAIYQIAFDIKDGEADPKDAKRLLALFCDLVDRHQAIPKELLAHFRDSFRRYLDGEKKLEAALGFNRKRGQPSPDNTEMALGVLRLRFAGESHQNALELVAVEFKCVDSTVGAAWKRHKLDAWIEFRIERNIEEHPFSEDELDRLVEIVEKPQKTSTPK